MSNGRKPVIIPKTNTTRSTSELIWFRLNVHESVGRFGAGRRLCIFPSPRPGAGAGTIETPVARRRLGACPTHSQIADESDGLGTSGDAESGRSLLYHARVRRCRQRRREDRVRFTPA